MKTKHGLSHFVIATTLLTASLSFAANMCSEIFSQKSHNENRPGMQVEPLGSQMIRLNWDAHIKSQESALRDAGYAFKDLTFAVIVNGTLVAKDIPWTVRNQDFPLPKEQTDFYVEIRAKNKVIYRSSVAIKENFDSQNVKKESFASILENRPLKFDLPRALTESGYSGVLSNASLRLGYEKISWVLKPEADKDLRAMMSSRAGEIDVQLTMNAKDEPQTARIVDRQTGQVLREVSADHFYFKLDAAFSGNSFFWDDMLVSLATVPYHPWLVRSTIQFWLDVQNRNGGVIPREVRKANLKSLWFLDVVEVGENPKANLQFTNPYLIDWVAEQLYRFNPSKENLALLKKVGTSIENYTEWMYKNRSVYAKDGTWMGFTTNSLGSGLDNSRGSRGNHFATKDYQTAWVDMLAQEISMLKNLSNWYDRFAKDTNATFAQREAYALKADQTRAKVVQLEQHLNRHHWNEKAGFYFDLVSDGKGGFRQDDQYFSIAGFWPLYSGSASKAQVERIITEQLTPEHFGGEFPLPANSRHTLGKEGPQEDGYWDKWAHWPSMATVVAEGFRRSGRADIATDLSTKFLRGMEEANNKTVAEFYGEWIDANGKIHGRVGQHGTHKTRLDFAGWGKVPPLYLVLKDVFGIEPQASGAILWNMNTALSVGETVRVHNLELHGEKTDLSLKRVSTTEYRVESTSASPLTIELRIAGRASTMQVSRDQAGTLK